MPDIVHESVARNPPPVRRTKRLGHALRLCKEKCGGNGTMHDAQAAEIKRLTEERNNAVRYEQDVEELAKCRAQLADVVRERDELQEFLNWWDDRH